MILLPNKQEDMGMDSQVKCQYCGVVASEHRDHCPTKDANPEWAQKEWQKGLDRGWADEFIEYYVIGRYSPHFQRGFKRGKDEIQACIDSEWEYRMSGGGQEEY